jgi:hypothetical protein
MIAVAAIRFEFVNKTFVLVKLMLVLGEGRGQGRTHTHTSAAALNENENDPKGFPLLSLQLQIWRNKRTSMVRRQS